MPSLFISYRRADNPDTVKLIYERLKHRLPRWDIFYDHDSIAIGEPFPEKLRAEVTAATAVFVIIGPNWMRILRERQNGPSIDHVRQEVSLALRSSGTFDDLRQLVEHNGRPVRPDPDFDHDLERLVSFLQQLYADESVGATLADKYRLTAEVGSGGMGVVYAAQQIQPVKRVVAVKLIKPGMDSREVLARFDAERQALALMDHPNIAKVFDAGLTASGRPFFAMEFVKGVPITQYCDEKRLTLQERLDLLIQVCHAVQHAHQKGIIHRDLKPTNVLVEMIDDKPTPKVIDFGLAKALGKKLTDQTLYTAVEVRVGTLEYSSPEQAAGKSSEIDTRSDIYALGVMLYEILTGEPPFTHAELLKIGDEEMRRVIRETEPTKPSKKLSSSGELPALAAKRRAEPKKLARLVQGDLDWIVLKCLAKEPARRYETANQLGLELQRFLTDEPVLAGPPTGRYRLQKFVRRNRGIVVSGGLLLLALSLGTIGTAIGLWRAERAKSKALASAENEKTAKEIAQKRLAQIEADNEIILSIFANLDTTSEEKEDRPLQAILGDRLVKAAAILDETTAADPLVVSRLRARLAESLVSLDIAKPAIPLFEKSCQTFAAELGPDNAETLRTKENLARAYQAIGALDTALRLFRDTLDAQTKALGIDDKDSLVTQCDLAATLQQSGSIDQALTILEDCVKRMKTVFGPDSRKTLLCMTNLAACYRSKGRLDESAKLLEEALAVMKVKLGTDDNMTLECMKYLALTYQKTAKQDLAVPIMLETVKLARNKLGRDHGLTLGSMNNLALAYQFAGRPNDALPIYQEVFSLAQAKYGRTDRRTLVSMSNMARGYRAVGKLELAIPLSEEALNLSKVIFGPDHENTLASMAVLSEMYLAAKKPDSALPLMKSFLAGTKKQYGGENSRFASIQSNVARDYLKYNLPAEAESLLRDALAFQEKNEPDAWTTFESKSLLGAAIMDQKKYTDAEPMLLAGFEGLKKWQATIPESLRVPRMTSATERLVHLYDAWGKLDPAKQWRKKLNDQKVETSSVAKP